MGGCDAAMNIAKMMIPASLTVTLTETATVKEGMALMRERGFTAIPVLNAAGQYLGSVTEGDFLRHVMEVGTLDPEIHSCFQVGSIYRRDFCPPLGIDAPLEQVIDTALRQNFIPIVDGRNALCGIVTRRAVIAELAQLVCHT